MASDPAPVYRVLARKYRPQTFTDLIGQDVLVRTLTNAFATGRLAHAFILTGVRGVGKTTTARIIAKGLNCVGPDGAGGPTITPCGVCEHCRAITEDRHVDVLEMDAASHTGVDDIREILDGVRYRPVSAREKVYIIDEVHMLSRNAFNALLKTLEEPPAHVTFVFATTEIRKVPVTVLSRCQRFDLRRIDADTLAALLGRIAATEGARVAPEALALLARAAEGSARDGLSLLDQVIAADTGEGEAGEEAVRAMLGLAGAARLFDLFEALMRGQVTDALGVFETLYDSGVDPEMVLRDLLDLTHWLTRLKLAPGADAGVSQVERERGRALADTLSIPVLSRAWQVLLKGLGEVQAAPSARPAAEMVLIRLAYAAELPPPGDLARLLRQADSGGSPAATSGGAAAPAAPAAPGGGPAAQARAEAPAPPPLVAPKSFPELVDVFSARREPRLRYHLVHDVHLVRYEPGRIELRLGAQAPPDLPGRVVRLLRAWFGTSWTVILSDAPGDPPLEAQARAREADLLAQAERHPVVCAVLEAFPGARVRAVTMLDTPEEEEDDGSLHTKSER